MPRNRAERVAIFVDVSNLYFGAMDQYGAKMFYDKFMPFALGERTLIRAVAYMVEGEDANCGRFKLALTTAGFEVRSKPITKRADGSKKANWDIAIALEAIAVAPRVDTVVLGSGDGDFEYLAYALRSMGCRIEVVSFQQCTASNLIQSADEYKEIPRSLCDGQLVVQVGKQESVNEAGRTQPDQSRPRRNLNREGQSRPDPNHSG